MIPAVWYAPLPFWLWEVALHSLIMGAIFYAWAHRVRLPSGRTKRRLLVVLLILPIVTASVPGRAAIEFRERLAWLNSGRILALPLGAGLHVYHLALLVGALVLGFTVWQEVLPALRRPATSADGIPDDLVTIARAQPGWSRCDVALNPSDEVMVATRNRPGRPRLIVSRGAIARLTAAEIAAVVAHEHAHWRSGRWAQAVFFLRLLQCGSPVAMWCFREYCLEVEVACDAEAVSGRDPALLIRPLLRIYESTDRRDVAARGALRKRVDVMLAGGPQDDALPTATIVAAAVVMLMVLPWVV